MILTLQGPAALSEFRRQRLLHEIREIEPAVTALGASYVHLVETIRPLTEEELDRLKAILDYGPTAEVAGKEGLPTTAGWRRCRASSAGCSTTLMPTRR